MPILFTHCFSTAKQCAPYIFLNLKDTISRWNPPKVFLHFIYTTLISNILCNFPSLWQIDSQDQEVQVNLLSINLQHFTFFFLSKEMVSITCTPWVLNPSPFTLLKRNGNILNLFFKKPISNKIYTLSIVNKGLNILMPKLPTIVYGHHQKQSQYGK